MDTACGPAPPPEHPARCVRLTLHRPCARLRSQSSAFVAVLHEKPTRHVLELFIDSTSPSSPASRKRRTTACRSSSCGRWARLLAGRARQLGEYLPCPRLAAQPQLASLPLHPMLCLRSRSQASTAPFAASCPAPQPSSQARSFHPLVLAAGEPSAQGPPSRDLSSPRPLAVEERRRALCGARHVYGAMHRVRACGTAGRR